VLANPKPQYAVLDIDTQCPVMESDSNRSVIFDFLEMKRRVKGIFFQKFIVSASQLLHSIVESFKTNPEIR